MSSPPFLDTLTIDADGHPIVAHVAGAGPGPAPMIVASHGITANAMVYSRIAEEIGDIATFVAVEHRGRGDSSAHPGPYGIEAHARDCVGVLDHLEADRGVLVGHSMGAFVVARAAADFADRVSAAILLDGGLQVSLPPGTDPARAVDVVVGPAVARLGMTWADRQSQHEMWQAHPAFKDWSQWHERYVDHDVEPGPGEALRCRVSEAAVRFDGAEAILDPLAPRRIYDVRAPAWLLRAPRGMLDDPAAPLLTTQVVGELQRQRPDIEVVEMPPDVNHYNIVWSDSGATAVTEILRAAVAAS